MSTSKKPPDPNTSPSPEPPNRHGGGGGGAVPQACAACKHQRRRCAPNCPLAPYFPAEKQTEFLNAHKLFGVSNLVKILKNVPPHERENAMKSAVYEAHVRTVDPVGGCCRIIRELDERNRICEKELDSVRRILAVYRAGGSRVRAQLSLNHDGVCDPIQSSSSKGKQIVHAHAHASNNQKLVKVEKHASEPRSNIWNTKVIQNICCDELESLKDEIVEQYLNDRPNLINGGEDIKPDLSDSGVFKESNNKSSGQKAPGLNLYK